MKILNRKEFLKLPPYTLYSNFTPYIFENLSIKGDTVGKEDFITLDVVDCVDCANYDELTDLLDEAMRTGASIDIDTEAFSRDGCFDYKHLYAVWEKADVLKLALLIDKCVENYENTPSST